MGSSLGGQLNSGCARLGIHPLCNGGGRVGAECPGRRGCVTFASYFPSLGLGNFLIVGWGSRSGKTIPWDSLGKPSAQGLA